MAVLEPFEQRTGIEIEYSSSRDLPGTIRTELDRGAPPRPCPVSPVRITSSSWRVRAVLRDLTSAIELPAYQSEWPSTFIDLELVDGRLVGMFLRSSVKGLIPGIRPPLATIRRR